MNSLAIPTTNQTLVLLDDTNPQYACVPQVWAAAAEEMPLQDRVLLLLTRDLLRLGWHVASNSRQSIELVPPETYDKNMVRTAMAHSRNDVLERNRHWIQEHIELARDNLASGKEALTSRVVPRIEVCETQRQADVFRFFRYSWSSPSSDYVGRRMRILIRDDGVRGSPLIGIAAIGSSIIHIPVRDKWIGWDTATRTDRIIYMMDAYVIGAVPPYNFLLGGKLVSYALASNELRAAFANRYAAARTLIKKREASDLVLLMTTSLYGQNSSQYNRLKYGRKLLYEPIGVTSGYGSLHISHETFNAMQQLVLAHGQVVSNRFGDGPNWRMRVIRSACDILALDSDVILRHSFQRGLFAVPLARNYRSFLNGNSQSPAYRNMPLYKLASYWRSRWLTMRKQNDSVIRNVRAFSPDRFTIR